MDVPIPRQRTEERRGGGRKANRRAAKRAAAPATPSPTALAILNRGRSDRADPPAWAA